MAFSEMQGMVGKERRFGGLAIFDFLDGAMSQVVC
jgi:hypothetical protein